MIQGIRGLRSTREDLYFRIHQISYRRFPQGDGGDGDGDGDRDGGSWREIDEALWLVPAFLPQQACTRGWSVWFELANLYNQYPVTREERHQDKGRFGGCRRYATVEGWLPVSRERVGSFLFRTRMKRWKWWASWQLASAR